MDDPIFEPWSIDEESTSASVEWRSPPSTLELLRLVAASRLKEIGRRLRAARHETSVEDLLDEPPRLIRFQLKPWAGPFAGEPDSSAMLEIGLAESDERVTAWYWLGGGLEAPHEARSVPSGELTADWIERVILDFVGKVLERS